MGNSALTYDEIRAFETALRKAIERSDLTEAEALIRTELARAPDVLLQEVIDRPLEELRIRDWDNIAADMEAARRRVPEAELERELGAVLLGLINRNNVAGLPLSVAFTFDAEPHDAQALFRPSYMTDAPFEAWQADFQDRIFLPEGARYKAYPSAGAPHLAGLEELRGVHDRRAVDLPSDRRDAIYTAHSLAAAIVLLRFHQLVERYLDHPGLPRRLPVFVHVETAEWPMETNTIDYGTQATRRLKASADQYDPAATARVAARVRAERKAALLAETREVVTVLRELDVALSLWPWWRQREKRTRFCLFADTYVDSARAAVARAAPGEAAGLTGERLCERFAQVRLGHEAALALEYPPSLERPAVYKLAAAYARKFGGRRVREALAHVPLPPEKLLRTGDYDL
jgi:hypothetical protein